MKILFIHKGFPGQFKHILVALLKRGDQITYIGPKKPNIKKIDNFNFVQYTIVRGNGNNIHPLTIETESKVIRGEAVAREAARLHEEGYKPDLIIGHPGWGEMLFIGDIWPSIKQIHYVEYCYGAKGTDADFEDEYRNDETWMEKARTRMKNAKTEIETLITKVSKLIQNQRKKIDNNTKALETNAENVVKMKQAITPDKKK